MRLGIKTYQYSFQKLLVALFAVSIMAFVPANDANLRSPVSFALDDWHYRIPVQIQSGTSVNSTISVDVDFANQLSQMGISGTFDMNSVRVVRPNGNLANIQEYIDVLYNGGSDASGNGRGQVRFISQDGGPVTYYIYFDITQNGTKPTNPQTPINGSFELGSVGQEDPPGWSATKTAPGFDAQIRASENPSITTNGFVVEDSDPTVTVDGTPFHGGKSYLLGARTNNEPNGNKPAVTLTKSFTVPSSGAGNLVIRYRPQGWGSSANGANQNDFLRIRVNGQEFVGPTSGNYTNQPFSPNQGTGNASYNEINFFGTRVEFSPGRGRYNGWDISKTYFGNESSNMNLSRGDESWFTRTINLSSFAGQTVNLTITSNHSTSSKTWFHIDQVEWSVVNGILGTAEAFGVNVTAPNDTDVSSISDYSPGQTIVLRAQVDAAPTGGITANIIGTAGNTVATNIPLFDDGSHGDATAGDGIYTNDGSNSSDPTYTIPAAGPLGSWTAHVYAKDNSTSTVGAQNGLIHRSGQPNTPEVQANFYNIDGQQFTVSDVTPPGLPQNVSATAITGGNIEIEFDDVDESGSGVASYSIRRSTTQGGAYTQVGTVTDDESANYTFTDNNASDGTTYYYVVTAIDGADNESVNSAEVSATADGTAPTVEAATVNGQNLEIDYSEVLNSGSVPATGDFDIQVNGSSRTVTNVAINGDKVNLTLNPAVVFGDNISGSYTAGTNPIEDQVGNDADDLSGPVTNNTPDGAAPTAPQNVSAIALVGGNITISFDDVDEAGSGVVSYSVKRSTTQGGAYAQVGTITDNESANYTFTDNNATDGLTYYYIITAIDGSGNESVNSAEVSATADATAPILETATVNGTDLKLNYDETLDSGSTPATGDYTVRVNGSPRSVSTIGISGDEITLTLSSGVNPGDTIELDYTAGANAIQDPTGNEAANLSGQAVTNNSDNTPPVLNNATANGSSLRLTYSETLDNSSVPSPGDYTVLVNANARSVTGVQINGNQVDLTFNPAAISGDNVQLNYTAGANPIQDIAGNDAANLSNEPVTNNTFSNNNFGPDPCPIINGQDAAWACFDGTNNGTSMSALVGNLEIATVDAFAQTTFSPNALQEWASGEFSGDEYNGPQANPGGNSGNATSFDINIPSNVPSDALVLALNRLRPDGGNTSYTMEAFDSGGTKIAIDDWETGQGTDGGVCTNTVNLVYSNGNTTVEFRPTVSGNSSCASSSTPIWFRITDDNVARIEIRKTASQPDNIHLGLAIVADFGDAPNVYNTRYNSRANPPAFHLLNNDAPNTVFFGSGVDGDGNGRPNTAAIGDDNDSGIDSGDDEDGIASMPDLTTADTEYSVTLSCTTGGSVGGWIDFDQSDSFDFDEYASGTCAGGNVTLTWTGLSGLNTGQTYARFRIATNSQDVSDPVGFAADGEVEDYVLNIVAPDDTDLEIVKSVDNPTPVEGDNISFTVDVINNGPDDATGIKVTDQLPAGLTFVSATPEQGTYNNSTGVWNVGSVSASETISLVINATVDSGTQGQTITNEASITDFNESDPNPSNNTATSGVTVVAPATDIAVAQSVDINGPNEGALINFTITVTNNGPRQATNLDIIDQIPSGLTYQSDTPSVGSYDNSSGIWTIGNLANGDSETLNLEARVDQGTEGSTITNTAAVDDVDQADNVNSNNSVSVDVTVVQGGPPVCGGPNETPTLSFNNWELISGTAGQVGAVYEYKNVRDDVDAEIEIITINNTTLNAFDLTGSGSAGNFQPQVTLNGGQTRGYIDFEIRFKQSGNTNSVFITLATSGVDVDGDGTNAKEYVGFQQLTSFTYDPDGELDPGSEGIYTTFTPSSTANATGIDVNNTEHLVYTTYTNEPQFRVRAGVIATGGSTGSGPRFFSFNFDPCNVNLFGGNGQSSEIVDVGVTKTVDDNNPEVGDTITYTIDASNNQENAVDNIEITDQLPNGLTFVSATPGQGTYNNSTGIWDIGTLEGQQSETLTIQATVNNGTQGDVITNTASFTDFDGSDGNTSNNSASVALSVFDPGAMACTEPPYFSFQNPTLQEGVARQEGAVYRFSNIRSGLDGLVEIVDIQNAVLSNIDADGSANSAANFSPLFDSDDGSGGGNIDFEISFVQAGTNIPVKQTFALSALDIDGNNTGNATLYDYLGFSQNQASTLDFGTNLERDTNAPFDILRSSVPTDAQSSFDTDHIAYIEYKYTSVLQIRTGTDLQGSYGNRLVDIDFRQCIIDEFDTPVDRVTRDADIAVNKTTDNANPLSGETVNFEVTVTNNGPENATELDINEAIPAGLTLVQANPSQGTYNTQTKIWAIGTLNSGNAATLDLETTVNQGADDNLVNKAFVRGLNQFDPTVANDTSQVALQISIPISGTVFEDKTGNAITDGDTNFGDATGDQQARANVEVHLFSDGGDGVANGSDDTYIGTTTTNSTGAYSFQVGENGDYWIAVDSRTGGLSNGTSWAEQTYAPAGALCTDGAGNTTTRGSAGVCFGGRRGDVSDLISATPTSSDLANAEHVAQVTMSGSEITGINFGFSFNVVTNVDDGDDDTGANRSLQGSLRQFIQNANTISGANAMRFVPAVATNATGSGGSWWSTTITSPLPAVTDALTTIDGTAFNLNSPLTELDTNPGSVGTGGTVGVDQLSLNTFERKEFEVNLNDVGANGFRINSTGAINVRDLALYNNNNVLRITQTANGIVERNMVGARADGTDPAGSLRVDSGIDFDGSATTTVNIRRNYIAFAANNGIQSDNAGAGIQLNNNEIYQNGLSNNQDDGIAGIGTWTIESNLIRQNGNGSSESVNGGSGIELGSTAGSTQNNTIRNNTIRNNTVAGITVLNSVSSSLMRKNIINANGSNYTSGTPLGAGVKLTTPASQTQQGINISQNSFFDNYGLAVDIVKDYGSSGQADGVNPNDGALQSSSSVPNRGLDYPVFTLATLEGSTLHVEGYVGTFSNRLPGPFTIEIYKAEDDGNNDGLIEQGGSLVRPHGEGKTLISTITTNANGEFSEDITVGGSISVALNDRITALAFTSGSSTSEFSSNQRVVPTGVTVSGYVYHDNNHNGDRTSGEPGIESVTMVLFNETENNCKSVLTNANGFYEFGNVLNGNYQLIEAFGESVPTPDVCTPTPADPTDHISTTPNTRSLTINNLPVNRDFGDFEGSRIQGNVFNDNGIGGGTAHDVIRNGGETGIGGTVVRALNSGGTILDQTNVSAGGVYTLYIAKSEVPSGGTAKIKEVNKNNFISIDADAGTTAGTYNRTNDEITFTNTVGTSYTGVNFSDVENSQLFTDGEQNVQPGGSALFSHQFSAKTSGSVIFTSPTVYNPSGNNFPVILYRDTNSNGEIDSGEPVLTDSDAVSVTAGQTVNLVLRVTVPPATDDGTVSTTSVTASMDFSNTTPVIQQVYTRTDVVNVTVTNGGLALTKAVDKAQALPGETLMYSITYENNGSEPISSLEIDDNVPAFTNFASASCGTLPNNLTDCTINAPAAGQSGAVIWTFTGTLAPGQSGTVSYQVTIEN